MSSLSGVPAHFVQSGQRGPERGDPVCLGRTQKAGSWCSGTDTSSDGTGPGDGLYRERSRANVALTAVANRKLAYSSFNCVHDNKTC